MLDKKKNCVDYVNLANETMRKIVKVALKRIKEKPKEVCYLLIINTRYGGVVMPKFLKKTHPNELRLLMKNEFHNFVLMRNLFKIDVKVDDKYINLVIPLKAISFFSDQITGIEFKFAEDHKNYENCALECDDKDKINNLINFSDLIAKR
jgi:hypothetical protein